MFPHKIRETITDYIIRVEKSVILLKTSGEIISDSLFIAMVFKGLPVKSKHLTIVITQMFSHCLRKMEISGFAIVI